MFQTDQSTRSTLPIAVREAQLQLLLFVHHHNNQFLKKFKPSLPVPSFWAKRMWKGNCLSHIRCYCQIKVVRSALYLISTFLQLKLQQQLLSCAKLQNIPMHTHRILWNLPIAKEKGWCPIRKEKNPSRFYPISSIFIILLLLLLLFLLLLMFLLQNRNPDHFSSSSGWLSSLVSHIFSNERRRVFFQSEIVISNLWSFNLTAAAWLRIGLPDIHILNTFSQLESSTPRKTSWGWKYQNMKQSLTNFKNIQFSWNCFPPRLCNCRDGKCGCPLSIRVCGRIGRKTRKTSRQPFSV